MNRTGQVYPFSGDLQGSPGKFQGIVLSLGDSFGNKWETYFTSIITKGDTTGTLERGQGH